MSLRRQLPMFLGIGLTCAAIDAAVYAAASFGGLPIAAAKAMGFIAGAIFAFLANGRATFAGPHRPGALFRFALVYATSLQLNVLINALVLALPVEVPAKAIVAFVVATGCTAAANFVALRYLVFARPGSSVPT